MAVDAAGTLYVANGTASTVTEYPAGSTSPSVTISHGLNEPFGLVVDTAGTLYVANNGNSTVTEYPAGSSSSSSPSVTINVPLPQGVFAVPGPLTP